MPQFESNAGAAKIRKTVGGITCSIITLEGAAFSTIEVYYPETDRTTRVIVSNSIFNLVDHDVAKTYIVSQLELRGNSRKAVEGAFDDAVDLGLSVVEE